MTTHTIKTKHGTVQVRAYSTPAYMRRAMKRFKVWRECPWLNTGQDVPASHCEACTYMHETAEGDAPIATIFMHEHGNPLTTLVHEAMHAALYLARWQWAAQHSYVGEEMKRQMFKPDTEETACLIAEEIVGACQEKP